MNKFGFILVLALVTSVLQANTIIVDINGSPGTYTSINTAIGVANSGDTVKVWPGTYFEKVTLNKDVTLMGSGYENTRITGPNSPATVIMSAGRLQWFMVSSTSGNGINLSGGSVKSVVVIGSQGDGIYSTGTPTVINCILYQNNGYGIRCGGGTVNVTNCIARLNSSGGFAGWCGYGCGNCMNLSYSNGSRNGTTGNVGCVDCDPGFVSPPDDFHISEGGCSWNTGNPSYSDPDGSRSDMGYFGGPDCPIHPVVHEMLITPGVNSINIRAKARANY